MPVNRGEIVSKLQRDLLIAMLCMTSSIILPSTIIISLHFQIPIYAVFSTVISSSARVGFIIFFLIGWFSLAQLATNPFLHQVAKTYEEANDVKIYPAVLGGILVFGIFSTIFVVIPYLRQNEVFLSATASMIGLGLGGSIIALMAFIGSIIGRIWFVYELKPLTTINKFFINIAFAMIILFFMRNADLDTQLIGLMLVLGAIASMFIVHIGFRTQWYGIFKAVGIIFVFIVAVLAFFFFLGITSGGR